MLDRREHATTTTSRRVRSRLLRGAAILALAGLVSGCRIYLDLDAAGGGDETVYGPVADAEHLPDGRLVASVCGFDGAPWGTGIAVVDPGGDSTNIAPCSDDGAFTASDLAVDAAGRIYVHEEDEGSVRSRITSMDADGGGAVVEFETGSRIDSVTVSPDGDDLYFRAGSPGNYAIRRVTGRTTSTVVRGTAGHDFGDFREFVVDDRGNVYGALQDEHVVVRISPAGARTVVAGTGVAGFSGDRGPAVEARLDRPNAVDRTPGGNLLIVDAGNERVRRVDTDGRIATVAGGGTAEWPDDGSPALRADLNQPYDVAAHTDGAFWVVTEPGTVHYVGLR